MRARATVRPPSPLSKTPIGRGGRRHRSHAYPPTGSGTSQTVRDRGADAVGRRRDHEHDVELPFVGFSEPRVEDAGVVVGVGGRVQHDEARPADRTGGAIASSPTRSPCASDPMARAATSPGSTSTTSRRGRVVALERAGRGDLTSACGARRG